MHDTDDAGANNAWDKPDCQDDAGGYVAYCDGRVSWVSNKRRDTEWKITRDIAT